MVETDSSGTGIPEPDSKPEESAIAASTGEETDEPLQLVDELGVHDLREIIFGHRGRAFSAAGREAPIGEFRNNYFVMHPPQKPFEELGEAEDISMHIDERGVLLNELGQPRKITGARFNGYELWWLGERAPDDIKHYAGWFDSDGKSHKLYMEDEPLTADEVYRLRNRTHDGEISIFPEVTSD